MTKPEFVRAFTASLAVMATSLFLAGPALAEAIIIDNVTLIDGTGAKPKPHMTVVVDDGHFTKVTPSSAAGNIKGRHIDGQGKYLIPGLMDMHIHLQGSMKVSPQGLRKVDIDRNLGIADLHSYLYCGVTSVFDAGNIADYIFGLRADERAGKIEAPHIFATGTLITYPGSHGSGPASTDITDWPESQPLIDKYLSYHPDVAKFTFDEEGWGARPMITLLSPELMQHVIEYINDHGIRTVVHTSSERRARQAIFAGIDNLAHPVIQGPVSDSFVKLMAAKKIPMTSTLTIGDNYSRLVEHPEFLDQPLYKATFSADRIKELKTVTREQWKGRTWTWWMKLMTPIAQENLRKIYAAGGILATGTDKSSGPALQRELELMQNAGIPPLAIIRMATLNGAVFLGKQEEMGSVTEGKLADAVLLSADPSIDINNAKKIVFVMKSGKIIDMAKLSLAGDPSARRKAFPAGN